MKFFKKFIVSIDFSIQISINSLASGAPPPNPLQMHISKISKFCSHFRQKFDKIFKKTLKKIAKFS